MQDYKELKAIKKFINDKIDSTWNEDMTSIERAYRSAVIDIRLFIEGYEANLHENDIESMIKQVNQEVSLAYSLEQSHIKLRFKLNKHWSSMVVPLDRAEEWAKRWLTEDGAEEVKAVILPKRKGQ